MRVDDAVSLCLDFRAPYDIAAMLRFLGQRAIPGVEVVDGLIVRRSVRAGVLGPVAGWLAAEFVPGNAEHPPHVQLRLAAEFAPHRDRAVAVARRWLDLDAAPELIDAALGGLPGAPGLRLPGSVDAFEMAVRAVLGQQVTVAAARTLARRLVEHFGASRPTPWPEVAREFPAPERLADTAIEQVAALGVIRSRAGAIIALAQRWPVLSGQLCGTRQPGALMDALCAVPGIGPWTAHYIAMRALGWPDAFPPRDVAVLNALRPIFGTTTHREAEALAERWRPWRSYAVLRLWGTIP